jgi:hypothetical protein
MTSKTVIFNHIPKTAGLTLSAIMNKQYSKDRVFSTLDLKGVNWKGGRREAIDYFKNLSNFEQNQFDLITGHSALELFNALEFPIVLIMLRYPVERVMSLYSYVRRKSWHEFYQVTNQYSLVECFENNIHNEWKELSNGQSSSLVNTINKITVDSIDSHIDNLEEVKLFLLKFCLVGLVEKFDESLVLFRERLSWKNNIYYHKINVSKKTPELNPETREIILEYNKDDLDLYNFAVQYFDDLVNSMEINFKEKVQIFKSRNKLVMPLLVLSNRLNYYVKRISERIKFKF